MSKDKDNEKKGGKLRKFFLFAILYNLVSDLVGGVSVTLADKR